MGRETLLSRTFVELADTLVDEFDIVDLLTILSDRTVTLLGAAAVAILLADAGGTLQVMAASSERARLLELFQLQNHEGPCYDCFTTGRAVVREDLSTTDRWPRFRREAVAAGYLSVHALPMRLRSLVIGTLNIFMDDHVAVSKDDLAVAQGLADVATIAILQNQATREAQVIRGQLQQALNSRVAIEQAKGVLAERAHIDMDQAFSRLRRFARDHNRQLSVVAIELVQGTLSSHEADILTSPTPSSGRRAARRRHD